MDTLHIILCGTETASVDAQLQGSIDCTHYAWNKRYTFSCVPAPSIDAVDKRLLLIAHAIVLCRGCRSPRSASTYGNVPVLSLDGASGACVEEIRDREFYYGAIAVANLRTRLLQVSLAPTHVVYDSLLHCLTPLGERCFQRAFWLFDRDCDGVLLPEELVAWRRQVESASFVEASVGPFLTTLAQTLRTAESSDGGVAATTAAGAVTLAVFLRAHQCWLEADRSMDAWATLYAVGTGPNGLPYTWQDVHSLRVEKGLNTYLSGHGVQFFTNLFKLKHFDDGKDMWSVTPGCAWEDVDGFRKSDLSLDKFIEYWKYMALERRDAVIKYARSWGYKGDAKFLFAQRASSRTRTRGDPLPTTLQALVVGSSQCGKRSLVRTLTPDERDETSAGVGPTSTQMQARRTQFVRTSTFFASKSRHGTEEPQTIIYTAVSAERAGFLLASESAMTTVDVVLLCFDGSDMERSGRFLMQLYTQCHEKKTCTWLPFVMVMTKADLASRGTARAASIEAIQSFCYYKQLLWPPVITSAIHPEEAENVSLSEYVYTVACEPDIVIGTPPLTFVRVARRTTLAAIVVVVALGAVRSAFSLFRRKQ